MGLNENKVFLRLMEHTESHLNHFLETISSQVINNEASLFLGAGISRNSGYPNWKKLLEPCAEDLGLSIDDEVDLFSLAQFFVNKHSESDLRRIISREINRITDSNNLLELILDIEFEGVWTTNYDKLIEQRLTELLIPHNVISSDRDLANIHKNDRLNIYKLNGDISNPSSVVITKKDYENYKDLHPLFLTFLKKELVSNTFLFLGYSFTDDIVLDCLSSIKSFLGDSANQHYALMMVDDSVDQRFEYFCHDLKKRYGINCIFSTKNDLPRVINLISRRIKEGKVFISGAYDKVSEETNKMADLFSREITHELLREDYRISTGVGKRLGTYITGYANQYLAENRVGQPAKYLSMRPFPFHLELSEGQKVRYRMQMQRDCSAAIFMFGQSRSTSEMGSFEKTGHYSHGVYQEFEIAKKLGLTIIPLGVTEYESRLIWNEVNDEINQYYYLSKKINVLSTQTDPEKISKVIVSILRDVSKNSRIQ